MANEFEIMEQDNTVIESGGLLDTNADNILYLAERADQYLNAMNRIMEAALKITTELDWVIIGGKPYLQESGATKVARLFGVSWTIEDPTAIADKDGYKTFTFKGKFYLKDQSIEAEGSRSMKDDFFAKTKNGLKKPDEVNERDVRQSAYTNCINNGIKRLIPGLRNIDIETLEKAGLQGQKFSAYTFKEGTKGGASKKAEDTGLVCAVCGVPITQKVASYSQSKFGVMLCMDHQKEKTAEGVSNG